MSRSWGASLGVADEADDGVVGREVDAFDAGGVAAHGAGVVLVEADRLAVAGAEDDVVVARGGGDADE